MLKVPLIFVFGALSILMVLNGCKKRNLQQTSLSAAASTSTVFEGFGTDFEAFGKPYGGCGVPEKLLYDDQQKKLPYIALNVQNTPIEAGIIPRPIRDSSKVGLWDNGQNCGRWIKITVGNDCRDATQLAHEGKICVRQDGSHGESNYDTVDDLNGKVLYGVIADSCQDPNYWCRDSEGHVDISTHELTDMLQEWGKDRRSWNNRQVTWNFIDSPPAKFQIGEPKFAWSVNAKPVWPALVVYNLKNGLSRVEYKKDGVWTPAQMNSDMGQLWILGVASGEVESLSYDIRIYDVRDNLIGTYSVTLPASCSDGCSDFVDAKGGKAVVASSSAVKSPVSEETPVAETTSTETTERESIDTTEAPTEEAVETSTNETTVETTSRSTPEINSTATSTIQDSPPISQENTSGPKADRCLSYNGDGYTCDGLGMGTSTSMCKWDQKWECVDGCAKWVSACDSPVEVSGNTPGTGYDSSGTDGESESTDINCRDYNQDGLTCSDVGVSGSEKVCKWGQEFECYQGCAKWLRSCNG